MQNYIPIDMDRKISLFTVLLLIGGMGGIVAQTVLLRELLIIFSGNELSIGVIIGAWVIWEALGAFIGGRLSQKLNIYAFVVSIVIFSVIFPASIYLTRIIKVIFSMPPDIGTGIIPIVYLSALILMPTGAIHGLFFTLSCSIHNQLTGKGTSSTAKVYFFEMLGTIAGGILVSFIFIPYFNSFQIAFIVAILSLGACTVFMPSFSTSKSGKAILITAAVLTASVAIAIVFNIPGKIHNASIAQQWKKQNVVFYENSIYQNIVVVKNDNQFTVFTDGIPFVTVPVPDITFVEEFVHFPLITHTYPENVLVIGGGAGGLINEILKYKTIKTIDYVEIDPLLIKTINSFSTSDIKREFGSSIVKTHYTDGKIFLRKSKGRYDAIFIGLPPPSTLQTNRFYTQEFFSLAKSGLRDNGILAITMPGSLTYYNNELKELNLCIYQTLRSVFPYVFILPGDFNLFIASPSTVIEEISAERLFYALKSKNIDTRLITQPHIEYRFDKKIKEWFFKTLDSAKSSVNRDFSPKGLYYNITYQNLLFSPSLQFVFDSLKHLNIFTAICIIATVFFIFLAFRKRLRLIGIPYAIATTGFSVIIFELALIFGFQILYGYLFFEVGILITVFMAGMAFGGLWMLNFPSFFDNREYLIFKITEFFILLFAFLLFFMFYSLGHSGFSNPVIIRITFYCLLFISGLFAGIEFPLSNKIFFRNTVANTAGILYSADLIGGCIGGIAGGLILIPVLGLLMSCILIAVLKVSSIILLLTHTEK